jgi:hypothetical protein
MVSFRFYARSAPRSRPLIGARRDQNLRVSYHHQVLFCIGVDTCTGVDDTYKPRFQFTGKIDKLTFDLGPTQLSSDEHKLGTHSKEGETSAYEQAGS